MLVHQPNHESPIYVRMLALLGPPHLPTPVGILRQRELPAYESEVLAQIEAAQARKGTGTMHELLHVGGKWVVE